MNSYPSRGVGGGSRVGGDQHRLRRVLLAVATSSAQACCIACSYSRSTSSTARSPLTPPHHRDAGRSNRGNGTRAACRGRRSGRCTARRITASAPTLETGTVPMGQAPWRGNRLPECVSLPGAVWISPLGRRYHTQPPPITHDLPEPLPRATEPDHDPALLMRYKEPIMERPPPPNPPPPTPSDPNEPPPF
jgi:hypothetical protein